MLTVIKAR